MRSPILRTALLLILLHSALIAVAQTMGRVLRADAPELLYIRSERLGILNAGDVRLLDVERGLWRPLTRGLWAFDLASTREDRLLFAAGLSARAAPQLYMLSLTSGRIQRLSNLDQNHIAPAWTPDGSGISFIAARNEGFSMTIQRVGLLPAGAAWDTARVLTPEYRVIGSYAWSPDGAWIAYTALEHSQINLYIVDAQGTAPREIATDLGEFASVFWESDSTHVIYGRLIIAQVDLQRINIRTGAVSALTDTPDNEHVAAMGDEQRRVAYVQDSVWSADHVLVLRDLDDPAAGVSLELPGLLLMPVAWSPDGSTIAFTRAGHAGAQLYTAAADGGRLRQITFGAGYDFNPLWRR